jgi:hypothetical protein
MGPYLAAFLRALAEAGYVENKSVAIEYRYAEGQYDRLPLLAADLVRRQAAVIVAGPNENAARAAIAASSGTPVVPILWWPHERHVRQIHQSQDAGAAAAVPVVCRTDAGRRQADGSRSAVVMSGVVDSGRESGHGNIDANDPKATCGLIGGLVLVGCASAELVVRPAAARVVAALPKAAAI